MRIELVHVLAQLLVRSVGSSCPRLVRVDVPHQLGEVNYSTEQVAKAVQVLDHGQELDLGILE